MHMCKLESVNNILTLYTISMLHKIIKQWWMGKYTCMQYLINKIG